MQRRISHVPGRLRVRDQLWRNAPQLTRLRQVLEQVSGVRMVETNPRTGSLLVLFDPALTDAKTLLGLLGQSTPVSGSPPSAQSESTPKPKRQRRSMRLQVNQAAKLGMIGSLGVSLGLAAAGAKKGHALAGGAFLAVLAAHLTVHRRHILR